MAIYTRASSFRDSQNTSSCSGALSRIVIKVPAKLHPSACAHYNNYQLFRIPFRARDIPPPQKPRIRCVYISRLFGSAGARAFVSGNSWRVGVMTFIALFYIYIYALGRQFSQPLGRYLETLSTSADLPRSPTDVCVCVYERAVEEENGEAYSSSVKALL